MKKVEAALDTNNFIKVHESFIVCINSNHRFDVGLTLEDETNIPVFRAKRKELLQQLMKRYQMVQVNNGNHFIQRSNSCHILDA